MLPGSQPQPRGVQHPRFRTGSRGHSAPARALCAEQGCLDPGGPTEASGSQHPLWSAYPALRPARRWPVPGPAGGSGSPCAHHPPSGPACPPLPRGPQPLSAPRPPPQQWIWRLAPSCLKPALLHPGKWPNVSPFTPCHPSITRSFLLSGSQPCSLWPPPAPAGI